MNRNHAAYALLVVQVGVGRYLERRAGEIRAHEQLSEDLGLDAFDIALIAVDLETKLGIRVSLDGLRRSATVYDLAGCIAIAIMQSEEASEEETEDYEHPMLRLGAPH